MRLKSGGTSPGAQHCKLCGTPLSNEYYRIRGRPACSGCAALAQNGLPATNRAAFERAFLFGSGAAIVGLIAFIALTLATGTDQYAIFVALVVGYLIAKAMKFGSGGLGGRSYQVAAVLLTYLSIAFAQGLNRGLGSLEQVSTSQVFWGLLLGIAFPFSEFGVHGIVSLVTLFAGLVIAWRGVAAKPVKVDGPFRFESTAG
jgi:hypothetical protein